MINSKNSAVCQFSDLDCDTLFRIVSFVGADCMQLSTLCKPLHSAALQWVSKHGHRHYVFDLAVRHGHRAAARTCLTAGVDIYIRNNSGQVALETAAGRGDVDMLSLLLPHYINNNHTDNLVVQSRAAQIAALERAAMHGHVECVSVLLPGMSAYVRDPPDENNYGVAGTNALILAARRGQTAVAHAILHSGINLAFFSAPLAFTEACEYGSEAVVQLLLEICGNGVLRHYNRFGHTSLELAITNGHDAIAVLLVQHNAPLNVVCDAASLGLPLTVPEAPQPELTPEQAEEQMANNNGNNNNNIGNAHGIGGQQAVGVVGGNGAGGSFNDFYPQQHLFLNNRGPFNRNVVVQPAPPQPQRRNIYQTHMRLFPLHAAVGHGLVQVVEAILDTGFPVNTLTRCSIGSANNVNRHNTISTLEIAVTSNHIEVVALLLSRGADPATVSADAMKETTAAIRNMINDARAIVIVDDEPEALIPPPPVPAAVMDAQNVIINAGGNGGGDGGIEEEEPFGMFPEVVPSQEMEDGMWGGDLGFGL